MPAPRSTDRALLEQALSVPAKAFILGEYAVLGGLPAVVATFGPRFGLRFRESEKTGELFDPRSPAGLLAARANPPLATARYQFEDPFEGTGGFGASTAQFALLYMALAHEEGGVSAERGELEWYAAWELYREITSGQPLPPSGADLIAQWRGGVCAFDPRGEYFQATFKGIGGNPACADLWEAFDWTGILVFSASAQEGRKVNTHEHLARLAQLGVTPQAFSDAPEMRGLLAGLREPLFRGLDAIRGNDAAGLGRAMEAYAGELARLGLEARATGKTGTRSASSRACSVSKARARCRPTRFSS